MSSNVLCHVRNVGTSSGRSKSLTSVPYLVWMCLHLTPLPIPFLPGQSSVSGLTSSISRLDLIAQAFNHLLGSTINKPTLTTVFFASLPGCEGPQEKIADSV